MKAYVYDATTQQAYVEEFEPEGALRMLQTAVGGCVECCTPDMLRGRNIDMWVNEECLLLDDAPFAFTVLVNNHPVPVFGTAVFTRVDEQGDTVGLTDDDLAVLAHMLP